MRLHGSVGFRTEIILDRSCQMKVKIDNGKMNGLKMLMFLKVLQAFPFSYLLVSLINDGAILEFL